MYFSKGFYRELKILFRKNYKKQKNYLTKKTNCFWSSTHSSQKFLTNIYSILVIKTFLNVKNFLIKRKNYNSK